MSRGAFAFPPAENGHEDSGVAIARTNSAAASTVPLVRIHATLTVFAQGTLFVDENLFVFADGTVTGFEALSRDVTCNACPWGAGVVQGKGSTSQFLAFRHALAANAVGIQRGGCGVALVDTVGSGTYEVTWYGRNSRRNMFLVGIGGQGARCTAQVANILTAVETYAEEAGVPASNLAPFR